MTDRLPAIIPPGALTTSTDTYVVPALIAEAGDAAGCASSNPSPPTSTTTTGAGPMPAEPARRCAQPLRALPPPGTLKGCVASDVTTPPASHPPSLSPSPLILHGADAAEPHIRSPLGAADTKTPHTRGQRARKGGTNLYRGIFWPGHYTVHPPRSGEDQPSSSMAGYAFRSRDISAWRQHRALLYFAVGDITSERDQRFAGKRQDGDPADTPRSAPTRSRNQRLSGLSGWCLTHNHESSIMVWRKRRLPALEIPCSR
jgi:hypothetical protein